MTYDSIYIGDDARLHLEGWLDILDPMVVDKAIDPYRKGSRQLIDVCRYYRIILDGAHDSTADAVAAARLALHLVKEIAGYEEMTFRDLTKRQTDWALDQQNSLAAYFRRRGIAATVQRGWPV